MSKPANFSVQDLEVWYGEHKVLDRVSFSVAPGEALGIVGESGSGKTTAAMAAIGLLDPEIARICARDVRIGDVELTPGSMIAEGLLGRRIGVVFQNPMVALNPVATIGAQLTDHIRHHLRLDRRSADARALKLLAEVGISDAAARMNAYPFQFSGGMLQRITIAMALACDPELLIADEPTTALDATVQAEVVDLIMRLRRERGMSLIWITHDLALLSRIADRVAVFYGGRIAEIGPAARLLAAPSHPYSRGLLGSVQSLWEDAGQHFRTIEGTPPLRGATMAGCPFAPRCDHKDGRCVQQQPPAQLKAGAAAHLVACWNPIEEGAL